MAKPSSSIFIIRYLHSIPSPSSNRSCGISHFMARYPKFAQSPASSFCLPAVSQRSHFSQQFAKVDPNSKFLPGRDLLGFRHLSFQNFQQDSKNFAKKVTKSPAVAFKSAIARYREALGLQIEAFWKRHYLVVLGAGGVVVCILLWRILFGIANTFVNFSEGMAKYGFLALSSAIVAFTGLYFRSRLIINPDKVYRMAMRRLNTSAGILEVMGAPLTGTDLRAYVMSGGSISLKNFRPRLRSKRCFLIFPIQGSERKGLVSVEVKKKKGQDMLANYRNLGFIKLPNEIKMIHYIYI